MQLEPGIFGQPGPHGGVFVGGVVVDDQVNRQVLGDLTVDGAQELHELLVAVAGQALSDHRAGEYVEGGEQGSGAVPFVIVGHRLSAALDHRQRRLGAVQCLHRGLLVGAQHDRLLRRVQIQTDDIDELLVEAGIVGQLERRRNCAA